MPPLPYRLQSHLVWKYFSRTGEWEDSNSEEPGLFCRNVSTGSVQKSELERSWWTKSLWGASYPPVVYGWWRISTLLLGCPHFVSSSHPLLASLGKITLFWFRLHRGDGRYSEWLNSWNKNMAKNCDKYAQTPGSYFGVLWEELITMYHLL